MDHAHSRAVVNVTLVCTWIHHALEMGSLANARTALASELRAASPGPPMVPRLRAAGGGECARDPGQAEDREQAEEDGAEMVARWTKEQSPGGGPGVEDPGTASRWGGQADKGTRRRSKGRDSDAS